MLVIAYEMILENFEHLVQSLSNTCLPFFSSSLNQMAISIETCHVFPIMTVIASKMVSKF